MADREFRNNRVVEATIKNYQSQHQGGATLNITTNYAFNSSNRLIHPFFSPAQTNEYIINYLKNYPNTTDYWEVQNLNLASSLAERAGTARPGSGVLQQLRPNRIDQIRTRIDVQKGASDVAFSRSSIVETDLNKNFEESFEFKVDDVINRRNNDSPITVTVNYQYRPPAENYLNPYFEFSQIANFVEEFTEKYSSSSQPWNQFALSLSESLISQEIDQSFGFVEMDYFIPEYIDELSVKLELRSPSQGQTNSERWSNTINLPKGDALEAAIGSTQLLNEVAIFDLRQFDSTQQIAASVELDASHTNPFRLGFYRIDDAQGRVQDPITGTLLDPQNDQYLTAALSSENRIGDTDMVVIPGMETSSTDLLFEGGSLVAPFFVNTDEQVVVPYVAANSSSNLSIQSEDLNSLLLNDPSFCKGSSCTPVEINLEWFIS